MTLRGGQVTEWLTDSRPAATKRYISSSGREWHALTDWQVIVQRRHWHIATSSYQWRVHTGRAHANSQPKLATELSKAIHQISKSPTVPKRSFYRRVDLCRNFIQYNTIIKRAKSRLVTVESKARESNLRMKSLLRHPAFAARVCFKLLYWHLKFSVILPHIFITLFALCKIWNICV